MERFAARLWGVAAHLRCVRQQVPRCARCSGCAGYSKSTMRAAMAVGSGMPPPTAIRKHLTPLRSVKGPLRRAGARP